MTTRSVTLWTSSDTGRANVSLFTCPPATHTILKSIYGHTFSQPNTLTIVLYRPNVSQAYLLQWSTATGEPVYFKWEGWVVLEPSDQVVVYFDQGPIETWGSGALLPQPP